ncbi:hypothetical protein TNCV_1371151 [Trichonephila clavipes]|nr:hypothetical protein TNCV_1371151 [Trichonephila clavipes]
MDQASASDAQTQQRSLNSNLGDTISNLLVHLGGQLLNGSTSIRPNTFPQQSLTFISMARGAPHLPRR